MCYQQTPPQFIAVYGYLTKVKLKSYASFLLLLIKFQVIQRIWIQNLVQPSTVEPR